MRRNCCPPPPPIVITHHQAVFQSFSKKVLCGRLGISLCCWWVGHWVPRTARAALVTEVHVVGPTHDLCPHHCGRWVSTVLTAEKGWLAATEPVICTPGYSNSPPHGCPLWVFTWDTIFFNTLCSFWKFHPHSSSPILWHQSAKPFFPESPRFQANCRLLSMNHVFVLLTISQSRQSGRPTALLQVLPTRRISHRHRLEGHPWMNGLHCFSICFQLTPTHSTKPSVN